MARTDADGGELLMKMLAILLGLFVALAVTIESPRAGIVLLSATLALLLLVPELVEFQHRRGPGPPDDVARAWLATRPDALSVALVAGGPGRVADVVLAESLEPGSLDQAPDVRAARRAEAGSRRLPARWDAVAGAGMLRERGRGLPAGRANDDAAGLCGLGLCVAALAAAVRAEAMPVALALGVFLIVGPAVVALPVVMYVTARRDRFIRRRVDPRTTAGHRALDLAESEPWAAAPAFRVALHGLAAVEDDAVRERLLGQAPPSRWPDPSTWRDRYSRRPEDDLDDGSGWSVDEVLDAVGGEGWDAGDADAVL